MYKSRRKPAEHKGSLRYTGGETLKSIVFSNRGYIYSKVKPNLDPINVDQIYQLKNLLKTHEYISTLNLILSAF